MLNLFVTFRTKTRLYRPIQNITRSSANIALEQRCNMSVNVDECHSTIKSMVSGGYFSSYSPTPSSSVSVK